MKKMNTSYRTSEAMMIQQNKKPARVGNSKAGVSQASNIKSLPHFKEYENNILGCTLRGEMLADQWNGLLPNDFYYTRNQIIAQAILQKIGRASCGKECR